MHRSTDEFWALTPREVFACFDVFEHDQRLANYRAGLAPAEIRNVNRTKDTTPVVHALDYFEKKEKPVECAPAAEIMHKLNDLFVRSRGDTR